MSIAMIEVDVLAKRNAEQSVSVSSFHIGVIPRLIKMEGFEWISCHGYQYSTSVVLYVTVILERAQIDLLY